VDLSEESRWQNKAASLRRPAASWPGSAPSDEADADDEEEMPSEQVRPLYRFRDSQATGDC